MRNRAQFLLSLLVFALLVTACGFIDNGDAVPSGPPPSDGLAFPDEFATIPPELRDRGGVLRFGVVADQVPTPLTLDETSAGEQAIADLLYDGLTRVDHTGTVVPALAASWTVTDDRLVWTFALDPAATFSDGSPIAAADVVASLQAIQDLGPGSLAGVQLARATFDAPDAATVTAQLTAPFAPLGELLAAPLFGVTSTTDPQLTSGALMIDTQTDTELTLVPSPRFAGYLDQVDLELFPTPAHLELTFARGLLDVADGPGGMTDRGAIDSTMFLMNLANPAFADPSIRKAIILAIDPSFVAGGSVDPAKASNAIVPSGYVGARPGICGDCAYDPEAATALLGGIASTDLPLIHVDHLSDAESEALAAAIVGDLANVGLEARARPHTPTAFAEKAANGELALFQFGTAGSWPSAEAFLGSVFATDGVDNVTSFSDPAVDELLSSARSVNDGETRRMIYQQVEDLVLQHAVVVPLYGVEQSVSVTGAVRNLRLPAIGAFDPQQVWLLAAE